ncbi:patatin domain protein [Desulfovibrio sp. A2]|nr:patatin domain protein [Desulfovibrio sp. A2]
MTLGTTIGGNEKLDRGLSDWGSGLFDLVISAQGASVDYILKHELGDDYFKIDDDATPKQSKDIQNLDVVSKAATNTLLARGMSAAQRALGDLKFAPFRMHSATTPTFYHGPNANNA